MKILKVLVGIVIVLVIAAAGGLYFLTRYLETPEFKAKVLSAAKESLGTDVAITDLKVSIFTGVELRGVTIANPSGFQGNMVTANRFVLSYELLPLLQKKVHIKELSADKPVITLAKNAQNEWNYAKLGATKPSAAPVPAAGAPTPVSKPPTPAPSGGETPGLDIALSKLAITDGQFTLQGDTGKPLTSLQKFDLSTSVNFAGGKLNGNGKTSIETLAIANSLFARNVSTPVIMNGEELKLSSLSGTLAGGNLSGDIAVKLLGGFKYAVNLIVKNGDVDKLLQEANAKRALTGTLNANAAVDGTGGLPTMNGKGRFEIANGQLTQMPLQGILATLLQIPELAQLKFDTSYLDFTLGNNTLNTTDIKLASAVIQITGKGTVSLTDYSLNHDITLALSKTLLAKAPKEIQQAFGERPDGFLTLEFHVSGPYDSPKTDIPQRLLKNAAGKEIQNRVGDQFKKLFK